jgi:predicted metal-binding membrane protein
MTEPDRRRANGHARAGKVRAIASTSARIGARSSLTFQTPEPQRVGTATGAESDPTASVKSVIETAAVLAATLATAAACWLISVDQMRGMDMGVATRLGSVAFFAAAWISMMAAMMLPGAIQAILQRTYDGGRVLTAAVFAAAYIFVWAMTGIVVYAVDRPHGTVAAGVVVIAAGAYELTPVNRYFRSKCRRLPRSGLVFGLDCVASSIGLMAVLVALGVMSVIWMAIIAGVVTAQKILPPRTVVDVALAVAIFGLGIAILAAPWTVPGLMHGPPAMPTM